MSGNPRVVGQIYFLPNLQCSGGHTVRLHYFFNRCAHPQAEPGKSVPKFDLIDDPAIRFDACNHSRPPGSLQCARGRLVRQRCDGYRAGAGGQGCFDGLKREFIDQGGIGGEQDLGGCGGGDISHG